MSRYIDADKLQRHGNRGGIVYWRDIEAQPTADVRENVKGEWVLDGKRHRGGIRWCHCSVCGNEENADYAIVQGVNFCPNCGADMRGEANV